jgi:hypothetical protein
VISPAVVRWASSSDNFAVTVAQECPTPHTVELTLTMTDAAMNTWESVSSSTVNSVRVISGHVRSNTGATPIANATVYCSGSVNGSVTTNTEGEYTMAVIDGAYLLHVESDDYLPTTPVEVTTPPGSVLDLN